MPVLRVSRDSAWQTLLRRAFAQRSKLGIIRRATFPTGFFTLDATLPLAGACRVSLVRNPSLSFVMATSAEVPIFTPSCSEHSRM